MARVFNVLIPASGGALVPISVCGSTILNIQGDLQIAYDEADFSSNQFFQTSGAASPQVLPIGSDKTILWCRFDPAAGLPATRLYVWTEINSAVV